MCRHLSFKPNLVTINTDKMIKKRKRGLFVPQIIICAILIMVAMSNCDTLEDDVIEPVTILNSGQGRAVLDGQSTVIDLKSSLEISVPVKTEIVRQPSFGVLADYGNGLYKYTADSDASGRQDIIGYTVSDLNDKLLTSDSILIDIVDQLSDSCQLVALPDIVYSLQDSIFQIDVLANDLVCDSLLPVSVKVVRAPMFGSAEVVNNEVVYTAFSASQSDEFVYEVESAKDGSFNSLAAVTILPFVDSCTWQVNDDFFDYSAITGGQKFDVLANDQLCDAADFQISIVQEPTKGQAYFDDSFALNFLLHDTYPAGNSDSLVYQLCINDECKTALVSFSLFPGTCDTLNINDDYFEYQAINQTQFFEVLMNDQLCNTDSAFAISVIDGPFNGQATFDENNTLNYVYSTGNTDSLWYQVCAGGGCESAMVRFSLANNQCDSVLRAIDDVYSLPDSVQTSYQVSLDVVANDVLCGNYFIDIATSPNLGTAEVSGNTILYTTNANDPSNDAFQYRLCDSDSNVCDVADVTIER